MIIVFSEPWFEQYEECYRFRVLSGPVQRPDGDYEFEVEEIISNNEDGKS